ncbi:TPA: phosphodiester glycosidase family protein [Candidatus Poribacteria bacterium]|nr:phosphodiester glycosidase family protein [Candidatus Poribacteria bacterium]
MKQKKYIFLAIITILVLPSKTSSALKKLEYLSHGLPEGVKIYKYRSDDRRAVLYVAEMDRRYYPSLKFRTSVARGRVLGRATVSDIVRQATRNGKNILVAINASFGILGGTYEGVIDNLHIQNGMLISPPNHHACFGVTKTGEFLMGNLKMNISINIAGKEIRVSGLNRERDRNSSLMLYTPRFGRSTKTNGGCEVVLSGVSIPLTPGYKSRFTVNEVRNSGDTPIPRDSFVLSAPKGSGVAKFLANLNLGDTGKLSVSLSPQNWNEVVEGIGGNCWLVKHGKIYKTANKGRRATKDDPRTALGYNDKKLFLMVVDGRQSGYSNGMSYRDVASAMIKLGATEAINLDGGGSSTFVVNGKLINRPSGGKERHVLNAVFITN